ncbi:MAG: hypothetical protein WC967_12845 [Balneolaceae bacterium]
MTRNFGIITFIISITFLLGGCVAHAPMSESLMFHDKATKPTHNSSVELGVAGTYSSTRKAAVKFAEEVYPEEKYKSHDKPVNANRWSGGFYLAHFDDEGRYAFSTTFGVLVIGWDASIKLWGRNYLTAAYSISQHGQLYVQHRAFNNPEYGISLGLGYQSSEFTFDDGLFSLKSNNLNAFGMRGFVIIRDELGTSQMKFGSFVGYAPLINQPIIQFTLSFGKL